jgi:hypothetical protein
MINDIGIMLYEVAFCSGNFVNYIASAAFAAKSREN